MDDVFENEERLRALFKTALIEVLDERKDILWEIFAAALEEISFSRAIDDDSSVRGGPKENFSEFGAAKKPFVNSRQNFSH